MTNPELTALIDSMDDDRVELLLQRFAEEVLTISLPPRTGLMMLAVHDSFATAFYPGEILVTEARVVHDGREGFGMVLGEAPRKALARAAADAILQHPGDTPIGESVRAFLTEEAARQKAAQAVHGALLAATKVNFDLMPGA